MRIAVDIDGVIATKLVRGRYPEDYHKKVPIEGAIHSLQQLISQGHHIMLFTSRPEEHRLITNEWLDKNGFGDLYDSLIMNKPLYDVFIDDRAIGFINWKETAARLNVI